QQAKSLGEFPHRGFGFLVVTRYLPPAGGPAVRNSANSVELLIFVTTQGSGPSVADGCSMMPRPTGIGPQAIERPALATVMKFCPLFWQRKNPSSFWSKLARSRPLTGTLIWSFI